MPPFGDGHIVFDRRLSGDLFGAVIAQVSSMRQRTQILMVALLILSLAPHAAVAKGRGHAKQRGVRVVDETFVVDRDVHRRIIGDYYRTNGLPPGLAKRPSLPPGLARQLRERGELPPGLQKRLTPVPSPLGTRLPWLPAYDERYFAGNDLFVVDRRSNRILSVIPNIF